MIHEPDDRGRLVGPIELREVGHRLEELVEAVLQVRLERRKLVLGGHEGGKLEAVVVRE